MTDSQIPPFWVVVPAAGVGARMGADKPKQYLPLLGKTILEHTLERLLALPQLQGITVVLSPGDELGANLGVMSHPQISIADGGRERCDSVLNGLASLRDRVTDNDWVLVHDA
ncbi:MAG: 2-C-methyl-D-erythritol 4-phosphate cytidylyltransferase, partial [Pseudomonadota bacterium]|nr:2-C-methyl-D-erythritol 4-phosphate cytidylyltransferase [Pseudomonadota bacterium]